MEWLSELRRRLPVLFRRRQFDRDLEEEMRFHLEMQAGENEENGMDPEEARYAARRRLGNAALLGEESREAWGWSAIEQFARDVNIALRMLRKNPGFTAVTVLVLALGIGANTAIFSAVNALLLNPFPFPEPDRVVGVDARHASGRNSGTGYRDFLDWRDQNTVFEEMAIVPWTGTYTLTGQGEPQRIIAGFTTAGFFRVAGVQPVLGRPFTAEEDRPGVPRVAVLSYAAWRQRFNGRADVLGTVMTVNDKPYTIVGVMPGWFVFPGLRTCDFFAPLQEDPANSRYQHQYNVMARLKPGVALERAQADMTTIARRLERQYPETNTGWGVAVEPIAQALAEMTKTPLILLFSTVAFVLLLACANVAGLALARASGRAKEMAVRASLGASRGRLVRQMLTESVMLALAGGALALFVAHWLMDVLRAAAPADFALDATLRLDSTVLAFAFAISLLTGIASGLAPAFYGSRTDLNTALKGGAHAGRNARSRSRFLSGLVAGEVALSLVLLAAAGLLLKDLLVLLRLDTGVRVEHVLTFILDLPKAKYSSEQRSTEFYRELLDKLKAAPGVEAAAAVGYLPMTGGYSGGGFEIEGRPKPADWMDLDAQYNTSTPGYFRTMGIPLLRGRDFDERDTAASLPVAIISDTLARRYFPGEDPVGRRIKRGRWWTIVGIAGSVKHQRPTRAPVPMVYFPHTQSPDPNMWVTVRMAGDPAKMAASVRATVRGMDGNLPVLRFRTMRQVIADSLSEPRLLTSLLAGFAAFALALAAIGIYGVIAYSVTQRTHEIGVRVTLGASYRNVMALVVRKGALLAGGGIAIGLPAALAASRLMASLLHGIGPRDLTVFAGVAAVLICVALAASYLPARRAATVDPLEAIRCE